MARLPKQQLRFNVGWSPPDDVRQLLGDLALKMRDRIELVIFAYREDHGGNSPTMSEIARGLDIPRANVQRGLDELILTERAERIEGKMGLPTSRHDALTQRLHRSSILCYVATKLDLY